MGNIQKNSSYDADFDDETSLEVVKEGAVSAIARSELESQIDCAHKYKRSIRHFLQEAQTLATLNREVAESCIYSLPRGGKTIAGPSVRMAEICASAYGNLHVAARIIGEEGNNIVAQGVAWDIEKNLRVGIEVRRRITDRNGNRFADDMVTVTGNAAASIALRNAIFRVVPRAYVDDIYRRVRDVAVGDARTLADRRADVLARLQKFGASQDRVVARLGVGGVDDIGLEQLETLIGLGTSIRNGDCTVDDAFPEVTKEQPVPPTPDGQKMKLGKKEHQPGEEG